MGVFYDGISGMCYTIGEDKFMKITNYQNQEIVSSHQIGLTPLTNLVYDKEYKRMFITNKSGQIFIYDASSTPVQQLNVLNMNTKCTIRGFHYDSIKNFIIGSGYDDGELAMFEIEKPGKEKYAKQIASFKSKGKVRVIEWSANRGEIYLGHEDGIITIWSAK